MIHSWTVRNRNTFGLLNAILDPTHNGVVKYNLECNFFIKNYERSAMDFLELAQQTAISDLYSNKKQCHRGR